MEDLRIGFHLVGWVVGLIFPSCALSSLMWVVLKKEGNDYAITGQDLHIRKDIVIKVCFAGVYLLLYLTFLYPCSS